LLSAPDCPTLAVVPPRLTHVALRATDLARSVDFYARYAGLVVAHEREEDATRVV
jgi:catechol 2,3-dioxygenase-like lactoylglutathione lyase family enzyme